MPHVRCHLSEIGQPETISLTINNRNHKSIEKLPNQIYFSQSIDIIQLSVGQKVESDHASISFVTEQHSHPTANKAVEIFICQSNFISVWDGIKEILVFLTSWSNCSFSAFISEVDTEHICRVLSIPSDPFQELHMFRTKQHRKWSKNFCFHKKVKA